MSEQGLLDHLKTGQTHVCQCWAITRTDGVRFGFTDHDNMLSFDGVTFLADSGLTAKTLAATTGLSVNNTEALGLLQSDVIDAADIIAGRYDGAKVTSWLVQWTNVANRQVRFSGTIGEITRRSGQFEAELRGLTDGLNQPQGRSYLRSCSAVLGDDSCAVDLATPEFRLEASAIEVIEARSFVVDGPSYANGWFEQGKLTVLSGPATGLTGAIKLDQKDGGQRRITLWHPLRAEISTGADLRLDAGCDKRAETCRTKFSNFINFQGFPDMPGEDWLVSVPRSTDDSDGGSLVR